ncbi:MAG: glutamate--tRNA ligase [Desulfurococcales archaeon]|nr:glutamate--tRNA ligase [Desulfurococcales archaeon]
MSADLRELVRGYALKNAVKYGGRANVGSVMSMILGDHPELKPRAREIARLAREAVEWANSLDPREQERLLRERYPHLLEEPRREERAAERGLPPLPGAREGGVVTRFAPNPDFVIHIGNARPAILSHEYARMYRGRMVLRFEDTDPRTKTPIREAYDLIREDLRWLGVRWDEEYIQSLRMEVFYSHARGMLERGCAYVDLCGEESRELLRSGRACHTREREPEWQLEQWDRMLAGEYGEGEAVVRVKTDLSHPNPSVRDWVALRIIDTERYPHPLVGSRYRVWPTYNFAVSVDDHLMGVTHVLRGKEHQVNTEKQLYVYRCFGWEPPVFIHFGRLKLEGFIMSKSKIRRLLEENPGKFLGYDDPRFGTIAGLRRRGILAEAIRRVILEVGVKPGDATLSWSNLAAVNRKLLDAAADRVMFVEDPVWLEVEAGGGCLEAEIPYHPDRPERRRTIRVCSGDEVGLTRQDASRGEVRLMGLGNFRVAQGRLELVNTSLDYARSRRLPIIHWTPRRGAVPMEVLEPVELEFRVHRGYAEPAILEYGPDSRLQLVRFGFARIDEVASGAVRAFYTHP